MFVELVALISLSGSTAPAAVVLVCTLERLLRQSSANYSAGSTAIFMVGVFDLIDVLADGALATPDLDYAHDCWLMKRVDEVSDKRPRVVSSVHCLLRSAVL